MGRARAAVERSEPLRNVRRFMVFIMRMELGKGAGGPASVQQGYSRV
jgi:hypothetical protein